MLLNDTVGMNGLLLAFWPDKISHLEANHYSSDQREIVKNAKGEMQFGGVIYSDSADKSARFIMNCNQKNIPLVFLQDVTGFMVGSKSEH